jgi:DNA-binding Xre family transcriptional regulator
MKKTGSAKLRIAELRVKHDRMTQADLAKQTGLSKTTISNLESKHLKRIELATIEKLCRALVCTPNELFELSRPIELAIVERQRKAWKSVLGSMTFDQPVNSDRLDEDLVKIMDRELKTSRRFTAR